MNSSSPITKLFAVALAAQFVGFFEQNRLSAGKMEPVTIGGVMTIEAPAVLFVVLQHDIGVHPRKFTPGTVGLHVGMTRRAWEDAFRKRRWRHFHTLRSARLIRGDSACECDYCDDERSHGWRLPLSAMQLDRTLHLTQPHGLEQLQTLSHDGGEIQCHRVACLRMQGEMRPQRFP
jgi:hypothetical protein